LFKILKFDKSGTFPLFLQKLQNVTEIEFGSFMGNLAKIFSLGNFPTIKRLILTIVALRILGFEAS
jgi:hypothetical protein